MTPTPNQIIEARQTAGHSRNQAAALVYVKYRTWQDWELGTAKMPGAAFELYQLKTGQIRLKDIDK